VAGQLVHSRAAIREKIRQRKLISHGPTSFGTRKGETFKAVMININRARRGALKTPRAVQPSQKIAKTTML
jgi:hypothetical protein